MSLRVVVTGIGLVTPFAVGREPSWQALHSGRSATRRLEAAECLEFDRYPEFGLPEQYPAGAPAPRRLLEGNAADPIVRLAVAAAREAVEDAGLSPAAIDGDRSGCIVGTSKGGLHSLGRAMEWDSGHSGGLFPAGLWSQFLPNAAAVAVAQQFGLRAACLCPVAACATGLVSVIRGCELIREGACDVVVAGSTDASLQPALLASFRRLGVLARAGDEPSAACRPFDRRRSGFLIGEGAGMLVLEREEAARARGAAIYGELAAAGLAADASGLTQVDSDAVSLSRLIGDVLRRGRVGASELDYVNLHGTATRQNDRCETRAVRAVLGAAADGVACSSLKGGLGHLLGAAGSVELAATLLAVRDQVVPPTVNLTEPDPECDLDYTPCVSRPRSINTALKLSLGFGGHLAAVLVRRVE